MKYTQDNNEIVESTVLPQVYAECEIYYKLYQFSLLSSALGSRESSLTPSIDRCSSCAEFPNGPKRLLFRFLEVTYNYAFFG